jgi:uncharacterized protein YigE (DUF2233 family)
MKSLAIIPLLMLSAAARAPDPGIVRCVAAPKDIKMYWKHDGHAISFFDRLKAVDPHVQFAMNGGMFMPDCSPVGLYVENGVQMRPLKRYHDTRYNFGLQPQGVFLIRDTAAEITTVDAYRPEHVRYATESSPILVIGSKINPLLPKSQSRTVRNGVGILPSGKVLFVLSNADVTFQEFAAYFVSQGCVSALYLDGGVSEAYTGGNGPEYNALGVLIGVVR